MLFCWPSLLARFCVCVSHLNTLYATFFHFIFCVCMLFILVDRRRRGLSLKMAAGPAERTHTHTQMIDDHFHFVLGFVCAGYWARFVLDALTRSRLGIFGAHMNERAHTLAKIAQRLQMHTRFWSREHTHTLNSILSINHFICILCLWDYTYFVMFSPPCTHLSACVRACVCAHALSVGKC